MIAALIPLIGTVLDKVLPDQKASADAKLKIMDLVQKGELAVLEADVQLALGQMKINEAEAGTDLFRGGWRPAVGWTCVAGLAYNFVIQPILPWVVRLFGVEVPDMPTIDNDTLMMLLTGMLGLGGLRTFERIKGKA
jgi:roadblock/LC7 domain-containing protein